MCQHDRQTPAETSPVDPSLVELAVSVLTRHFADMSLVAEWDGSVRVWCRRPGCHWQTSGSYVPTVLLDMRDHRDTDRTVHLERGVTERDGAPS